MNLNQQSAGGVGVSTPCGAVSTRGTSVSVPGVLELQVHGMISHPGMGPYHLPSSPGAAGSTNPANHQLTSAGGLSTSCWAVSTLGPPVFVPGALEL